MGNGSEEEIADSYWSQNALVWASASRGVLRDRQKLLANIRASDEALAGWVTQHGGSGKAPPPTPMIVFPEAHPDFIPCATAGMQAFTIEMLLKAALVRTGKKAEDVNGHDLAALWEELGKTKEGNRIRNRCEADLKAKLAAAQAAGYRAGTQDGPVTPIGGLLERHAKDFEHFRYGQVVERKGRKRRRVMAEQFTVRDRLGIFLAIEALEDIIVREKPAVRKGDPKEAARVDRLVETCLGQGRSNDPTQGGRVMDRTMRRWYSGEPWLSMADTLLRMKADDERGGGTRKALMEGKDVLYPEFVSEQGMKDGNRTEGRTARNVRWAIAFNCAIAHAGEVDLKTILLDEGKEPRRGKDHDHRSLWDMLSDNARERIREELAVLVRLAKTSVVNKPLHETTVEAILERMRYDIVTYRYLEEGKDRTGLKEVDADLWWERRCLCEAIARVAHDSVNAPAEIRESLPGPMSITAVSQPELRHGMEERMKAKMRWWQGRGMEEAGPAEKEDPVWRKQKG